jgi:hypothetical protein
MNQHLFRAIVFLAAILGVCGVARADSISPYVFFWPGVISIMLVYAFPASVLAAFLERPFLTAAGINHRALILSLRANFLSAVVGILLIPVGFFAIFAFQIGLLWCLFSFAVSCTVEIAYLRRFPDRLAWGWVIAGNAFSSVVLMLLPPIAMVIKQNYYRLAWSLEPHETWLKWASLASSLALFLISFAWRVPYDRERGAEVRTSRTEGKLPQWLTSNGQSPDDNGDGVSLLVATPPEDGSTTPPADSPADGRAPSAESFAAE